MTHTNRIDRLTCQVCGLVSDTKLDADVHATIGHDIGRRGTERTRRFLACQCGTRVTINTTCPDCGRHVTIPEWAKEA